MLLCVVCADRYETEGTTNSADLVVKMVGARCGIFLASPEKEVDLQRLIDYHVNTSYSFFSTRSTRSKPMKPNTSISRHLAQSRRHPRGFALVVTLSLMILLTVIAVGLLGLSSISLRSSAQGDAMQSARASARLALMLAIGDLQKQLGPDTRISATADQIAATTDPAVSTTPQPQRQWAGAYKAWPADVPSAARPQPEFLQWFVSGNPSSVTNKTFAGTALPADPKTSVEIVTSNTVGTTGDPVRVPLISQTVTGNIKNNLAWWVSDLGTKALIAPARDIPSALAEVRADQQVAPSSNLKSATAGSIKPFASLAVADPRLPKVATWQSAALLAADPSNPGSTPPDIRGLFHDLTPQNRGLLTNVRTGGFRKDLSMELERIATSTSGASKPPDPVATALYKVGTEPGINLNELWAYYRLCTPPVNASDATVLQRTGSATFTTGGTMSSGTPHLRVAASPALCQSDSSFYFKQPVIISYQMVLSFETRSVPSTPATNPPTTVNRLHLVADPILTFWNPLDVPVVVPTTSFFSVKYWQIPYDFSLSINGAGTKTYSLAGIWRTQDDINKTKAGNPQNGDGNFASLRIGQAQQLVFKPGEVIKVSQTGSSIVKGTSPVDHALVGKAGFNFGGGVSLPIRDLDGNYVDLKAGDVVTYTGKPNNLTTGATTRSGRSVLGTPTNHSRHYSLTHHEYYVGADRGTTQDGRDTGTSLGIGGMFIDWDFGNQRLGPGGDRGQSYPGIPGTKKSTDRLYANTSGLSDIFKTINDGRPLTAPMTSKQPFVLFSFNAKTEDSSNLGTRTLSRFNPKALHVDFYNLNQQERDMLPYEYSVQSLQGWKSAGSLEVTTQGNAYFGGGMTGTDGSNFVTTHSVPREPLVSLAAFQHSFANGFLVQKPKYGYATLNAREPLLPQISHAIGNSMASPMLSPDKTEDSLPGGRPLADHSYLANQALWDTWFLSGIAPQTANTFSKSRTQKVVATEFFNGTGKLPVSGYIADLRGQDPSKVISTYFSGTTPSVQATDYIASLIRVDGMFNVNSTSVEAWKSLLGGRKDRPLVVRDATGRESVKTDGTDTPVAGLLSPDSSVATGSGTVAPNQVEQWTGRRTLTDDEIDRLARGIVKEVRKRGPFLSLADFVNRRVGSDKDLARAGAIQNALDATDSKINEAYLSGTRAVSSSVAGRFAFKEAEEGPKAFGSPGIVKQADILTPIAPLLSARSDSFLIRGYGEKTDAAGKVIARAWCEAVVQRSPEFIDPSADAADKPYATIGNLNKTFGRRFDIVSFRWLSPSEA
jgi:Tfp pilus assembly protein PilV